MNFSYRKQSQFELFPGNRPDAADISKPRYPFQEFTVSPENMIIVCIALLMVFVFSFSLGVERGKANQSVSALAPKINALQNKTSAIIAPQLQQNSVGANTKPIQPQLQNNLTPAAGVNPVKAAPAPNVAEPAQMDPKAVGNFTIQVASFKLEKNAQREAVILKDIGYETLVVAKGDHFIVCVGRFAESDAAKKFTARLKSRYKDSVVRRL